MHTRTFDGVEFFSSSTSPVFEKHYYRQSCGFLSSLIVFALVVEELHPWLGA
jgi:hypothetical protein